VSVSVNVVGPEVSVIRVTFAVAVPSPLKVAMTWKACRLPHAKVSPFEVKHCVIDPAD
jgi:hypothetical protein